MREPQPLKRVFAENLAWFLASLTIAFFVWVFATAQLDPVEQYRLPERVPIRIEPDEGLVITNEADLTRSANVVVRAQRSMRELLTADDVIVWADLTGLGPGSHVVELSWEVAPQRRAVVEVSPRQITVNLEAAAERLVPVEAALRGSPAPGYELDGEPTFDVNQVLVSGPASRVEQVVAVQVELNIDRQREAIIDDVRPVPVDVDGNTVGSVSVDPQVIRISVDINRIEPE